MKTITTHQTNECNKAIELWSEAPDVTVAGVPSEYTARWYEQDGSGFECTLQFQNGAIKEVGTNGITHEVLLAILIDRLEGFQESKYASNYNAEALGHLQAAFEALEARTREREIRGVEGTHKL